jgi:hypothetical protein
MPFNRISSRVAIGLLVVLLASPMFGQGPLGMQIFAPADLSTAGGEIEPNEGYFFQFDILYWSASAPETKQVGYPDLTRSVSYGPHPITAQDKVSDVRIESNTLNSGDLQNQFTIGNRFEIGRVENRNGWFVSIYQLRDQGQDFHYKTADVVFQDPPQGPLGTHLLEGPVPLNPAGWAVGDPVVQRDLPVVLYDVTLSHNVETWGVELNYLRRLMTCHTGGTFEFYLGARYLEFDDEFGIRANDNLSPVTTTDNNSTTTTLTVPSFLSNSYWNMSAQNHVVGPQVGLRWFKKQGRWMLSTEGRFMAGLNCQSYHQKYSIGPNLNPSGAIPTNVDQLYTPATMAPSAGAHDAYTHEWSPAVELRLEGRYQLTRAISAHVGWTGLWLDNIARANAVINYTVPDMGIDLTHNKQGLFMNGITAGIDINR